MKKSNFQTPKGRVIKLENIAIVNKSLLLHHTWILVDVFMLQSKSIFLDVFKDQSKAIYFQIRANMQC